MVPLDEQRSQDLPYPSQVDVLTIYALVSIPISPPPPLPPLALLTSPLLGEAQSRIVIMEIII